MPTLSRMSMVSPSTLWFLDAGMDRHIPEKLGKCKSLKILDISFNSFLGPLPDTFRSLESIGSFIVEGNHLSGPVPTWISNWKHANSIRLSENQFSGKLPSLKLEYLTTFFADANQLS
ncbi:leucine-rich repeat receptor protein kinase MSP1 [Iris pallida]|uniref:Leucine-rich repeat receptor protein kinase MSP1 n=1 Tax=Iris pallida TaxID=29817 RepID=A0AAX6GNS2_IRIPA|nr:leucine-rich repeat receptor protein kinase MSP1 [Iris pallida]